MDNEIYEIVEGLLTTKEVLNYVYPITGWTKINTLYMNVCYNGFPVYMKKGHESYYKKEDVLEWLKKNKIKDGK